MLDVESGDFVYLGQEHIQTTLRVYAHLLKETLEEKNKKLRLSRIQITQLYVNNSYKHKRKKRPSN